MICRFKTHQSQPSIALSRSERTCRVRVEAGTKSSTSKTAIIKTHLLCSMFLVAPETAPKKKTESGFQCYRFQGLESPMIICWQTAHSSFVTIPKPKLFKVFPARHTQLSLGHRTEENTKGVAGVGAPRYVSEIVGMKHTTRSKLMKDIQDEMKQEQEPTQKGKFNWFNHYRR